MTPCVRVKPGVRFEVIGPAGFVLLAAIQALCLVLSRDVTISCGTEGHAPTDPHTRGEAYDLSVKDWPEMTVLAAWRQLSRSLGEAFTVLYEVPTTPTGVLGQIAYVNPHASAPHLHVQIRKGTSYPAA